jgi:hypothetical protein
MPTIINKGIERLMNLMFSFLKLVYRCKMHTIRKSLPKEQGA